MLHNGYAATYARCLAPFLNEKGITLAEFGILKGTGLSIWCDLFPDSRIIGLDIDLGHFSGNRAELVRRGAFAQNKPELHEYDQLVDNRELIAKVLSGRSLDVVIDDGLHSIDSIVTTWRSVAPHLSSRFVYFIEDYGNLLDVCAGEFAGFDCYAEGMLTVISSGVSV